LFDLKSPLLPAVRISLGVVLQRDAHSAIIAAKRVPKVHMVRVDNFFPIVVQSNSPFHALQGAKDGMSKDRAMLSARDMQEGYAYRRLRVRF
jgi:hypothetical protein